MFVWKALLNLTGLMVGAIFALTVWFTITAEPPKYNIDTRQGLAEMWLDADLESCARVLNEIAKRGNTMSPKHYMYKECNYINDPSVAIADKYAYVMIGR